MIFGNARLIAIAVAAALALGLYAYVQKLRADLATSEANNVKLEASVEQQTQVIDQIQRDVRETRRIHREVSAVVDQQRREVQALEEKLQDREDTNGNPVTLGDLAVRKPGLIESRINRGTANAYRCMEIASGAPLTEQEQNATKPSEINPECPGLANPRYRP